MGFFLFPYEIDLSRRSSSFLIALLLALYNEFVTWSRPFKWSNCQLDEEKWNKWKKNASRPDCYYWFCLQWEYIGAFHSCSSCCNIQFFRWILRKFVEMKNEAFQIFIFKIECSCSFRVCETYDRLFLLVFFFWVDSLLKTHHYRKNGVWFGAT